MDGLNEFNNSSDTGGTPPQGSPEADYTSGYTTPPASGPQNPYAPPYAGAAYPPPPPGTPNPGLAALLGFIPGVGAMYNGQFAKGIAHIAIFAVLTSLANHVNEIFGLFVAGWIFYMVFDAYQTARARRDGLQVPDPFGLNNIGERFGLGHGPNWNDFVARPAGTQGNPTGAPVPGAVPPYEPAPGASSYPPPPPPAAGTAYRQPASSYVPPAYDPAYAPPASGPAASYAPYNGFGYSTPVAPPIPPFDAAAVPKSGVPAGAVWLIGLGVLALLSSLGHNFYFHGRFFAGSVLIFIGAILLVQQLRRSRAVYPAHSAAANWYAVNSSRGGVFLVAIGIFMLLDAAEIARWHYTWPYLVILLGLYQLASRTAYNRMLAETPSPYDFPVEPGRPVDTPPPPAAAYTSIVPTAVSGNEEGR